MIGHRGQVVLLRAAVLCNDAELSAEGKPVGTATETALLQAGLDRGLNAKQLRSEWPRLAEVPFSSDRKRMATLHRAPDLTILNFVWAPYMSLLPHNHQMYAVIGI